MAHVIACMLRLELHERICETEFRAVNLLFVQPVHAVPLRRNFLESANDGTFSVQGWREVRRSPNPLQLIDDKIPTEISTDDVKILSSLSGIDPLRAAFRSSTEDRPRTTQ